MTLFVSVCFYLVSKQTHKAIEIKSILGSGGWGGTQKWWQLIDSISIQHYVENKRLTQPLLTSHIKSNVGMSTDPTKPGSDALLIWYAKCQKN